MVCVADRENGRVVCFDTDGKFVRALKPEGLGGRIFGISYSKGQVYAVSGPEFNPFAAKPTGYILNIDDGEIDGTFQVQSLFNIKCCSFYSILRIFFMSVKNYY